jgi:hypothetical protein
MQYVGHVEQHGKALFERVCKLDLEGIVAKHSYGPRHRAPADDVVQDQKPELFSDGRAGEAI